MKLTNQAPFYSAAGCARLAKKMTADSANLKDWEVRDERDARMRELARELVKKNGGYIIATPAELERDYPFGYQMDYNAPDADDKYLWGIRTGLDYHGGRPRYGLSFAPTRLMGTCGLNR